MIIYKLENKLNGMCYIGQTISSLHKRIVKHINTNSNVGKIINEVGIENFDCSIICECESKEDMNMKEKYYIEEYDSYNTGYNRTKGGENGTYGKHHTDESKLKMRGERDLPIESRIKIGIHASNRNKGKGNPNFKHDISKEDLEKYYYNHTIIQTAEHFNCSQPTIIRATRKYGIRKV